MAATDVERLERDLSEVKRDLAVIKYILSQEGELTEEAKRRLSEARETPESEYVELD